MSTSLQKGFLFVADSIDDLSALRIEREPLRVHRRGWIKWIVLLVILASAGVGA
jgi:hypothetical protein